MKTWTDEQLILHFYEELDDKTSAALSAALLESTALQLRYKSLEQLLNKRLSPEIPPPSGDLNQRIMRQVQAIHDHNTHPQLRQTRTSNDDKKSLANTFLDWLGLEAKSGFAVALTGMLLLTVMVFFVGRWSAPTPNSSGPVVLDNEYPIQVQEALDREGDQLKSAQQARRRVLISNVSSHIENSQRLLTEVVNSDADTNLRLHERSQMIDDLVEFNRLYRRLANQANDTALAQLLQQMEAVLLELSNTEDTNKPGSLNPIRERLEDSDLIYKLRVTEKKLNRETT